MYCSQDKIEIYWSRLYKEHKAFNNMKTLVIKTFFFIFTINNKILLGKLHAIIFLFIIIFCYCWSNLQDQL